MLVEPSSRNQGLKSDNYFPPQPTINRSKTTLLEIVFTFPSTHVSNPTLCLPACLLSGTTIAEPLKQTNFITPKGPDNLVGTLRLSRLERFMS
ncbi:hypothetical protein TNIN_213531 [Trichonephila inaurata madagascariensis]|uniref:Uncharacterized protein n=1 Tax=Trichonephila inaurata madagascariensis TaxID=2747483 RepID=A0A8X6X3D6_9ARAC|nr:hypothetical protein TNIN_213531 [Trichonephila inaurata madagascariensis]